MICLTTKTLNKMKEKDFTTKFMHWYAASDIMGAVECKLTKTGRLRTHDVRPNQIVGLHSHKHAFINYKIPDEGFSTKPFDVIKSKGPAWLVVMFYTPRKQEFVMIDIDEFEKIYYNESIKSITEEEARKIGNVYSLKTPHNI
jgi:hypothetical protein